MDALYTLLSRVAEDSFVLDLGCGRGSFHYAACRGRIVALDVALPALRSAEAAYSRADGPCAGCGISDAERVQDRPRYTGKTGLRWWRPRILFLRQKTPLPRSRFAEMG